MSPLTVAVAPSVGIEAQLLDKLRLSVEAITVVGLGKIIDGRGDLDLNGQQVKTIYGHNGSFWGIQVGLKYSIWRVLTRNGLYLERD